MSTKPIDAAVARLVRILRSEEDIRRGIRVDQRIANDGNVILDDDLGLIRMIENIDAARADLEAYEISLIDKLLKLRDELNDPVTGTFMFDTLTAANGTLLTAHTGETGAAWTSDGGTFTIHNERIYGTSTGFVYASGIAPINDYKVEAEFTRLSDAGENGIAVRIQPGTDTGYFLYYNFGAFRLQKRVNGVQSFVGDFTYSAANLPVIAGLAVAGDRLDVFVNGQPMLSVTDTSITAKGRAGLYARPITTTTGHHLDNIRGSAYVAQVKDVETLKATLTAELANKLEPGTPQSNIANLVSNLADKAATTYVNSEILAKTPTARILASNHVTSSTTASGIGPALSPLEAMTFPVGANQEWRVDVYLECTTSHVASGNLFNAAAFGIVIPTGATLAGSVLAYRSAAYNWSPVYWSTSGLNPQGFLSQQASGRAEIHTTIKTGATTGYMVVQCAVTDSTDTLTILSGSWADASRIINTEQGIE